jgi:hypothetical protein
VAAIVWWIYGSVALAFTHGRSLQRRSLWLRCPAPDVRAALCPLRCLPSLRAALHIAGLRDVDYRTRTFSCSVCGGSGALANTDPSTETGMTDFRLDQREAPERHLKPARRLSSQSQPTVPHAGGELPGGKLKGRR